jgi:hypothetical protein
MAIFQSSWTYAHTRGVLPTQLTSAPSKGDIYDGIED